MKSRPGAQKLSPVGLHKAQSLPILLNGIYLAVPAEAAPAAPEGLYITAPLVGTFYAAPSPGAAPFVKAGDTVKQGQTVCLLEAMKMMSEVKAPCDCVVEAVLVPDGTLVSFGESLIRYREG